MRENLNRAMAPVKGNELTVESDFKPGKYLVLVELSLRSGVRDSGGVKGLSVFQRVKTLSKLGDLTLKVVNHLQKWPKGSRSRRNGLKAVLTMMSWVLLNACALFESDFDSSSHCYGLGWD